MARPWMPLYVADYLADTGHLSTAEHGAYMLLIMHYWQSGGLPSEDAKLARICRMTTGEWAESRDTLADLFSEGWTHKRIDQELERAEQMLSKRRSAGMAGASARYSNRIASAIATAEQTHTNKCDGEGTDLDTHSEEEVSSVAVPRDLDGFDEIFWPAYQHKVGKPDAKRAFARALRAASLGQIMAGLDRYIREKPPDRPWLNPATFLNQQRWADQPADRAKPHEQPHRQSAAESNVAALGRAFNRLTPMGERAPDTASENGAGSLRESVDREADRGHQIVGQARRY